MTNSKFSPVLSHRTLRLGFGYLAFELLLLPSLLSWIFRLIGITSEAVANFIFFLINFLCCGWIFRQLLRESATRFELWPRKIWGTAAVGLVAQYLISIRLTQLIFLLRPDFANANDTAVFSMVDDAPFLMFLGTVFLAPLTEECLFRGLIFTPLRRRNRAIAYLVSVLAFSAVHVVSYLSVLDAVGILISLLQYLPAGLCLAWAYDRTESLFTPILIHSAINLISYLSVRLLYA